ncbi:hypothetical protein PACTADRAFT_32890 [Pachysolen tannophilus NRRL Y-2460]|uniref:Rab-GAP TBC domain-containing protein n=1 Tax=Pachysolen tannophilus NRRL Y-2460 TaxID=669874 RepID=A0A1E4U0B0_PACTA|nr:hypothetical protein PACTADRAFT_32890 [Pachysolen tannophilus NRRL Y-2460]
MANRIWEKDLPEPPMRQAWSSPPSSRSLTSSSLSNNQQIHKELVSIENGNKIQLPNNNEKQTAVNNNNNNNNINNNNTSVIEEPENDLNIINESLEDVTLDYNHEKLQKELSKNSVISNNDYIVKNLPYLAKGGININSQNSMGNNKLVTNWTAQRTRNNNITTNNSNNKNKCLRSRHSVPSLYSLKATSSMSLLPNSSNRNLVPSSSSSSSLDLNTHRLTGLTGLTDLKLYKNNNNSDSTISASTQRPTSSPQSTVVVPLQRLTPSQRLRLRRKQMSANIESTIRRDLEITNSTNASCQTNDSPKLALTQQKQNNTSVDVDLLSDDDLPDDLIVFNVPLSKSLKGLSRKERFIMNQPLMTQVMFAAPPPLSAPNKEYGTALRTSSLTDSNRSSIFSYNSVMTNKTDSTIADEIMFSDEANKLTIEFNQNLEILSNEESFQRKNYLKKLLQQNDINRDSMSSSSSSFVISQETSNHISNTRPFYLPPKDYYESLKHSKDYEFILNNAIKKETKFESENSEKLKLSNQQKQKDLIEWESQILPDFDNKIQLPSTRELWWRGIPFKLRARLWTKQIGNKLDISRDKTRVLFKEIDQLFKIKQDKFKSLTTFFNKIHNEILLVYPDLCIFQNGSTYNNLFKIVTSYVIYENSKAYDLLYLIENHKTIELPPRGLFTLSATLLRNIKSPSLTFIALCNILHRKLSYTLVNNLTNDEYLQAQIVSFDKILSRKFNSLYVHFKINNVDSISFVKTLCSYCLTNFLPLDIASRLMDIYIFEGDHFLLRCILGLFEKINYKLFGNFDEIMSVLGDDCLVNLNRDLISGNKENGTKGDFKSNELIFGYRYLDLGYEDDFIKCIRDVLRN